MQWLLGTGGYSYNDFAALSTAKTTFLITNFGNVIDKAREILDNLHDVFPKK